MASQFSSSTAVSASPGYSSSSSSPPASVYETNNVPDAGAPTTAAGPGVELAALIIRSMNVPAPMPQGDDLAYIELVSDMEQLKIKQLTDRFIGKSSGAMLVRTAVMARQSYEEKEMPWASRRKHFSTYNAAEHKIPHTGPFIFPNPGLLASLVELYFMHTNIYFPLLHRPTFERHIADGLHERDQSFGMLVLLVCAIGARFSHDPRICPPDMNPLRVGWQFSDQLPLSIADTLFSRPTLHQVQFYCLAYLFTELSTPEARWMLAGMGIRLAQEAGVHRLRYGHAQGERPTAEKELWKRAWWVLICLERGVCSALGRPCTTRFEDLDAELPLEIDDEYWPPRCADAADVDAHVDPELQGGHSWVQPVSKPSVLAYFSCIIRLNVIMGFSLQLLYGLNKRKSLLAHRDSAWETRIVAELDAALDKWVDDIPAHLNWDHVRHQSQDALFFNQSAHLYCTYYVARINIHRPLIQSSVSNTNGTMPYASLSICINAARAASHIIETIHIRGNGGPAPAFVSMAFIAGLTLTLSVWGGKRTGLPPYMNTAMSEIHKCMASLKACEERWQSAGLFRDFLHQLTVIEHTPVPRAPASLPSHSSPGPSSTAVESASRPPDVMHSTDEQNHSRTLKRGREHRDSVNSRRDVANQKQNARTPLRVPTMTLPGPTVQIVHTPLRVEDDQSMYLEERDPAIFDTNLQQGLQLKTDLRPARAPDIKSNTSSWYPTQESAAPLEFPDFAIAGYPQNRESGDSTHMNFGMEVDVCVPTQLEIDAWGSYFDIMSELGQGMLDAKALAGV